MTGHQAHGDGALVEFRSVVDAVRCAIEVQDGMQERNAGLPPDRRIEFRIGVHLGDVVEESDGDLMGDGVNIAARLEGICEPGGVLISEDAWRLARDRLDETIRIFAEFGMAPPLAEAFSRGARVLGLPERWPPPLHCPSFI